jgi:NAD(P)H-nitrite reductase large subunit
MAALMAARPAQIAAIPDATVVCRCEDITRTEIDQALADGALDVNQIKSWTRCGMGPCQGRICGDTVAALAAARLGGRGRAGCWSARIPLRPLDLAAFTGDYDYADIGIPAAAPL